MTVPSRRGSVNVQGPVGSAAMSGLLLVVFGRCRLPVGFGRGTLLGSAGPEAVGVAAGLDDVGFEGETIDHGGGQAGIREGAAPFRERRVAGHSDGGAFFSLGDDLEEQLGSATVEFQVAELVKAEQLE